MDRSNQCVFSFSGRLLCILLPLFVLTTISCKKAEPPPREISDRSQDISCIYMMLVPSGDHYVVDLVFKNNTGRNISFFAGGFRILDEAGNIIQQTGFSRDLPFPKNTEKAIDAFQYIDLLPESVARLEETEESPAMVFHLSEITFEDGTTVSFE